MERRRSFSCPQPVEFAVLKKLLGSLMNPSIGSNH
jgi:hypothetical protein